MEVERETQLRNCPCVPVAPLFPSDDVEFIKTKQTFLKKYFVQLVLHTNEHLVGFKPCFGKQQTSVSTLKSIYNSHNKDLKRLKNHLVNKNQANYKLKHSSISAFHYFNCFYMTCETFIRILSTLYKPTDQVSVNLLIEATKSQLITLSVFEEIINNGSSNGEDVQTEPQDRSSQLEESTSSSI